MTSLKVTTTVRMLKVSAGPAGVRHPGQLFEVSPEEADVLVGCGAAAIVTPTTKRPGNVERAVVTPPENAAGAPQRKRGR